MKRRDFLTTSGLVALAAAQRPLWAVQSRSGSERIPPPSGSEKIHVAVAITAGATVIDFCGPWEVFQDVQVSGRSPFRLSIVSDSTEPVRCSAGLVVVPEYTFANAPRAHVVVVPAQRGSQGLHAWLRKSMESADIVTSVCTGAFQLGQAGLLEGQVATTHHLFFDAFAEQFPKTTLRRGKRFVDNGKIASAGGLTSGIDMALHVVARYFGDDVAQRTAVYMEYESDGWRG